MKFTPGKWKKSDSFNRGRQPGDVCSIENDEWFIATIQNAPECEANANLIAAAPEMYEALVQAEILVSTLTDPDAGVCGRAAVARECLPKITAALSKAQEK